MEPDPGHELAFHQWYDDDHFYAGGMSVPWIFAGRRWVCPRDHRAVRISTDDGPVQPRGAGRFLHLDFFSQGHEADVASALGDTIAGLAGEGRMHVDDIPRRHAFSRIQPYVCAVYDAPDQDGPLDIHALDHPYGGVVVEVVRARPGYDREELAAWLAEDLVPAHLPSARAGMCLVCADADLPDELARKTSRIPRAYGEGADQRLTLLCFTADDPLAGREQRFAPHAAVLDHAGRGRLEFASPFISVVPGTNRQIDAL